MQALSVTHDYYVICLLERFIYLSTSNEDVRIGVEGYSLPLADHPSNKKQRGVCMYYKELLPITKKRLLMHLKRMYSYNNYSGLKKLFFSCLYSSLSKTKEKFEAICIDENSPLSKVNDLNIPLSVTTGDYNTRYSN